MLHLGYTFSAVHEQPEVRVNGYQEAGFRETRIALSGKNGGEYPSRQRVSGRPLNELLSLTNYKCFSFHG